MEDFKANLIAKIKRFSFTIKVIKWSILILVFAGIIIGLGEIYLAVTDGFSKKTGEQMASNPVEYETGEKNEEDKYAIKITEDQLDMIEIILKNMGTSKETIHLDGDKDLEKIYAAEVISKEINRSYRNQGEGIKLYDENPEKYYGRVYVQTAGETTEKEDVKRLAYIDYDTFYSLPASEILKYFTIKEATDDETDKLCVAGTTVTLDESGNEISSEVHIQEIDYKSLILKYMMPVEYLLDLAMITENPEFVLELTQKVLDETEIYLTVMYNKVTTKITTTYTYQVETTVSSTTTSYDGKGHSTTTTDGPTTTISDGGPEITERTVIETTPTVAITYVNTWFLEQTYIYNKVRTGPINEGPYDIPIIPNYDEWGEPQVSTNNYTASDGSGYSNVTVTNSRVINKKMTEETETYKENYEPGYIKDPKYKVDEFLELISRQYKVPDSYIKQSPIGKIIDGSGILLQMLSNNERTQAVEQIMRYILNYYTGTTDYGNIDFDSLKNFLVDDTYSLSKDDIVVDTSMMDANLILNAEQLRNAINSRYTGQTRDNLYNNIDAFIQMQSTYNVNAVFAMAVTIIESSGGTNWAAIAQETHNWMSVTGSYNGNSYRNPNSSNPRTWRVYPSFAEATMDFGNLIANGSYYFQHNRHSVKTIAPTYCNTSWGNKVVTEMMSIYNALGIDISENSLEGNA